MKNDTYKGVKYFPVGVILTSTMMINIITCSERSYAFLVIIAFSYHFNVGTVSHFTDEKMRH